MLNSIAECFIESLEERIKLLFSKDISGVVTDVGESLLGYLKDNNDIIDPEDLVVFKQKVKMISNIVSLLLKGFDNGYALWLHPLIKELYSRLGIDYDSRYVFLINSNEINDYKVYPDVLRGCFPSDYKVKHKPIDVFTIPAEVSYDISAISLIGHEVGHVYWAIKYSYIEKRIESLLSDFYKVNKSPDLFNNPRLEVKIKQIANHIEEYLCDSIGSSMMGPAFDFALIRYFISYKAEVFNGSHSHPPNYCRVSQAFNRLHNISAEDRDLDGAFRKMMGLIEEQKPNPELSNNEDEEVQKISDEIFEYAKIECFNVKVMEEAWAKVRLELDAFRPPLETVSDDIPESISPIESIIAMTVYYYGEAYKNENEYYRKSAVSEEIKEKILLKTFVSHLSYSISMYDFVTHSSKRDSSEYYKEVKKNSLWKMRTRIHGGKTNPLIIVPSIDPKTQYGDNSVDLRLGGSFLILRPTKYTHIDPNPKNNSETDRHLPNVYTQIDVPVGKEFILHPHQFVLACTLEYICLPYDFYALVLGRSSWGRMGLNIATATTVQAGYKGCLTLELRNLSETPLPLTVGLRIAQLCLIPIPEGYSTTAGYFVSDSKYVGPVKAEMPKIWEDKDWPLVGDFKQA